MRIFGIYFVIEIVLLVVAGRLLGIGLTLFIILTTAILGILVLRLAGVSTLWSIRQKLGSSISPDSEMIKGLLLGTGGILLLLPGLLGDLLGILLVIPTTRILFIRLAKMMLSNYNIQKCSYSDFFVQTIKKKKNNTHIIEGEWEKKDEKN